ncbi:MAG: hypothetical protein PHI98_01290 [Eubacteriales bacterium]|nr:hypothetical protein [Eubacteriales bacterium]
MEQQIKKLDELMDGAVTERFNIALAEVLENVFDPNTDPEKVRKIQLNISIKPNKNRDAAEFKSDIKVTCASPMPLSKTVLLNQRDDGTVIATERTTVPAGQLDMYGGEVSPNVVEFDKHKAQ